VHEIFIFYRNRSTKKKTLLMILTISSLLMMFANLMQQTKKIIQEKYLKNDSGNATTNTIAIEATDEQLDEKTQELKDQIYGKYHHSV